MARRSTIVAVTAVVIAAWPAGALAATAPASPPQLTSAPYATPATFHWAPAPDVLNTSQTVMRAPGPCTAPVAAAQPIAGLANSADTYTTGGVPDGAWCFSLVATDLTGGTAQGPGLTVVFDTANPSAALLVAGQSGGSISGVVSLTATGIDATSGVASSILHVGPVGACPAGTVLGAVWDTTGYANGAYDVCNVVTDNAGHSTSATVAVTIANVRAPASAPAVTDRVAPRRPKWRSIVAPRAKRGTRLIPFTLRWTRPAAPDLDRVVVVVNLKRSPKSPTDGRVLNRGLKTSVAFTLRSRLKAHIALYAYDHSGNVSRPARRVVALASLVPLRPLTGSFLHKAPQLRWRARPGVDYYNVQLFRNGKRVLVRWPTHPSYRLPAGHLRPGTYTWFVWPAVRHKGSAPTFGSLIGRSTFILKAR